MIRDEIKDLIAQETDLCYDAEVNEKKIEDYKTKVRNWVSKFIDMMKRNNWLIANKLTYIDFMLYDLLDHQRILFPNIFDDFHDIQEYLRKFEDLPHIRDFLGSDRYRKYPLWSERSFLGRSKENIP